jgi:hypothetical protein
MHSTALGLGSTADSFEGRNGISVFLLTGRLIACKNGLCPKELVSYSILMAN